MKILLLDNQDSFVYNVAALLADCGLSAADIHVLRGDRLPPQPLRHYSGLILSPGPGLPEEAPGLMSLIAQGVGQLPILGICLGHQAIARHFGARLRCRDLPRHGHTSRLTILDPTDPLLQGVANADQYRVGRYHSWEIDPDTLRAPLRVSSIAADDGAIMSVAHAELPIHGLQFHPESIITRCGHRIITNFLSLCR